MYFIDGIEYRELEEIQDYLDNFTDTEVKFKTTIEADIFLMAFVEERVKKSKLKANKKKIVVCMSEVKHKKSLSSVARTNGKGITDEINQEQLSQSYISNQKKRDDSNVINLDKDNSEINNTNNDNNIYTDKKKTTKEPRHKYGEFKNVLLSDKDLEKLKAEYGEELVEKYIKKMDEWIELNGRRYKNYYLALRQWMNKEVSKKQEKVEKQEGDTKYDEEYFTKLMEETLRGGNKF